MRNQNNSLIDDDKINFRKLASVFFLCSLISFLTSCVYSGSSKQELKTHINPNEQIDIGPLIVSKDSTPYEFSMSSSLQKQSWAFIEGEVLDRNKEYLYSFGKELWYESGYDSEGSWTENNNAYSIDMTFPKAGTYYFRIKSEANKMPSGISVMVTKSRGSALPHFWFGVLTLLIAIVLNQLHTRRQTSERFA